MISARGRVVVSLVLASFSALAAAASPGSARDWLELMAEAMLGPTTTEGNWLMITLNTGLYRDSAGMRQLECTI